MSGKSYNKMVRQQKLIKLQTFKPWVHRNSSLIFPLPAIAMRLKIRASPEILTSQRMTGFSLTSPEWTPHKGKIGKLYLHLNLKLKSAIAIVIIAIMLISIFTFIPNGEQRAITPQSTDDPAGFPQVTSSPKPDTVISDIVQTITNAFDPQTPGVITSAQTMNSDSWKKVAANAWNYFQPGVGVYSSTGLPGAGFCYPYFTDWDLGVYIQAVMDANNTGLISNDGDWGFNARIMKVLKFLETRELNSNGYPYWFYDARTGANYATMSNKTSAPVDVVDTGRLFVALNNLRHFDTNLTQRINNIVLYGQNHNRSNYAALVSDIKGASDSPSIYAYYFTSGYAAFFPALSTLPDTILSNMYAANITTYGITLPKADISCEPLFCAFFDSYNNSKLAALTSQVYMAHEANFNQTGLYVAFSEGNSFEDGFIYEWVARSDGRTWIITRSGEDVPLPSDFNPIIYNKIAFSFLAVYNSSFAHNMVMYLEQTLSTPDLGYCDGADYEPVIQDGQHVNVIGSNTNGLILSAANYAIHH
jgi:hypothetical protein